MSLRIAMELTGAPETPAEHSIVDQLAEIERLTPKHSADWYELVGNIALVSARMHWNMADRLREDARARQARRRPRKPVPGTTGDENDNEGA